MLSSHMTTPVPLDRTARRAPAPFASVLTIPFLAAAMQTIALPASATPLLGEFGGNATAAFSHGVAGPLAIQLSSSARAVCPCRGTHGVTRSNTLSGLSVGPGGSILSATESVSTALGGKTAASADTKQTSTITKTNLLGGLITGDTIRAVASVNATPDTLTPSAAGSKFSNLVVAGVKINPNVAPNTMIQLPGLGTVTLKSETVKTGRNKSHITVEMIRLDVLQTNSFNLPVGAELVVSEASAGYNRYQPPVDLNGLAYGTQVSGDAGSVLQETLGRGAQVALPDCNGTMGVTKTKSVTAVNVPGVLSLGTDTVTAVGGPVGNAQVAKTTANVENLAFLGVLVTANTITAVAQDSRTGNTSTPSTVGSGFGGLTIAGKPIDPNTPPNTTFPLAGLGSVVVNEQLVRDPGHVVVNGLHITITVANAMGLPVGTQIILAHADASATKF